MKWLSPKGRLDRAGFLLGLGGVLLFALMLDLVLAALPGVDEALILSGVWVVLVWPVVCLLIRRFRDAGSGPRGLWLFAPQALVALLSLLMSGAMPGTVLIAFTFIGAAANLVGWGALVWLAARASA
ncbi:MAG TPA: hypothetical protein VN042_10885 [Asticcacaulis sp.]|nr:hypothetical protein [Asticcacaulis sp.]